MKLVDVTKEAKVVFCSHECDLALVEVSDNFLDDMVPIELGSGLPSLRDMIYVLGFPIGGDEVIHSVFLLFRYP